MKRSSFLLLILMLLTGCASQATPTPWIITTTPVPPTQMPWIIVVTATPGQSTRVTELARTQTLARDATPDSASSSDTIQWSQTSQFVNQTMTVCGPVMRTNFAKSTNGQPTFIDLGRAYPDPARFCILIWGSNRDRFPGAPETLYAGKTLCVTGKIKSYQDTLELEATSASHIQVK